MESDAELRRELTEAIAKVRRQLEIMTGPSAGNRSVWGDNTAAIADLRSELAELQQALDNLDEDDEPGDGGGSQLDALDDGRHRRED
jgi:hypothetical protein